MKATEMVQAIQKAQDNIHDAIEQAIKDELSALSILTELDIDGISINLMEDTRITDISKTYAVQNVSISAKLPSAISGIYEK